MDAHEKIQDSVQPLIVHSSALVIKIIIILRYEHDRVTPAILHFKIQKLAVDSMYKITYSSRHCNVHVSYVRSTTAVPTRLIIIQSNFRNKVACRRIHSRMLRFFFFFPTSKQIFIYRIGT